MSLAPPPVKVFPAYARMGIPGAVNECYVREGVYRRLLAVARTLPEGLSLLVLDGWRPWRVQQYLFETLQATIQANHPELDEQELLGRTREFVAQPSTEPTAPSPHLTGGAVDVTLCDTDGLPLDMGTLFDEAVPASHADALEDDPGATAPGARPGTTGACSITPCMPKASPTCPANGGISISATSYGPLWWPRQRALWPSATGHHRKPLATSALIRHRNGRRQESPSISPSSSNRMSTLAGWRGMPGMRIIAPHTTTTKPAPAASSTSRIGSTCPTTMPCAPGRR